MAEAKKKAEAEKKRKAELAAKKKVEEEKKRKAEAERKRKEEEKRKAEAERKRQQEEARRKAAEQEMQARLAAEQKRMAVQRQSAMQRMINEYVGSIFRRRVQRSWIRPPGSGSELSCTVEVRLIPSGEVIDAQIVRSSGNPAFDRSVESAVFKASPLPVPPDPEVMEQFRSLRFDIQTRLNMKIIYTTLLGVCLYLPGLIQAALTIEITQGVEGAVPIAVVPFDKANNRYPPPQDVAGIIAADLARSGRFAPVPEQNLIAQPVESGQVRFQDWRTLGVENLVIGKVEDRRRQ